MTEAIQVEGLTKVFTTALDLGVLASFSEVLFLLTIRTLGQRIE